MRGASGRPLSIADSFQDLLPTNRTAMRDGAGDGNEDSILEIKRHSLAVPSALSIRNAIR
jgi:hypothetical protein